MSSHIFQLLCSFNAKNLQKYSFGGFRGVNVSKSQEVSPNHCGCCPAALTIFEDHFITFNLHPESYPIHYRTIRT